MEINAKQYLKVEIEPKDCIEKMLREFLGNEGNYVTSDGGKFYLRDGYYHTETPEEIIREISEADYNYIKNLPIVTGKLS